MFFMTKKGAALASVFLLLGCVQEAAEKTQADTQYSAVYQCGTSVVKAEFPEGKDLHLTLNAYTFALKKDKDSAEDERRYSSENIHFIMKGNEALLRQDGRMAPTCFRVKKVKADLEQALEPEPALEEELVPVEADLETADVMAAKEPAPLLHTVWIAERMDDGLLPEGVRVHLVFDGARLSGRSGCNQFNMTYTTDGRSIKATSGLAQTRMACGPEAMRVERQVGDFLSRMQLFEFTERGELLLKTDQNETMLLYAETSGD